METKEMKKVILNSIYGKMACSQNKKQPVLFKPNYDHFIYSDTDSIVKEKENGNFNKK